MTRGFASRALSALALAIALDGCSGAPSTTAAPQATSIADAATQQRSCIGALRTHLRALAVRRVDAFFAQTLNGLVVCDATYGLAHIPTREISAWLGGADGKPHPHVGVPAQPREIATLPRDPAARLRYQRDCTAWMRRYLPASIAKNGDDPDTAAANVFDGIEECDAVAGFATISREELARIVRAKDLD